MCGAFQWRLKRLVDVIGPEEGECASGKPNLRFSETDFITSYLENHAQDHQAKYGYFKPRTWVSP